MIVDRPEPVIGALYEIAVLHELVARIVLETDRPDIHTAVVRAVDEKGESRGPLEEQASNMPARPDLLRVNDLGETLPDPWCLSQRERVPRAVRGVEHPELAPCHAESRVPLGGSQCECQLVGRVLLGSDVLAHIEILSGPERQKMLRPVGDKPVSSSRLFPRRTTLVCDR